MAACRDEAIMLLYYGIPQCPRICPIMPYVDSYIVKKYKHNILKAGIKIAEFNTIQVLKSLKLIPTNTLR